MGKSVNIEERPIKKRKRKGYKVYLFFAIFFGISIILLSILVLFYVQKIEVEGNSYCTEQEIIDKVQSDRYSINTLYILAKHAIGRIEKLPCLDEMKLSLRSPWTLKVVVKEKPIVGYVVTDGKYAYFDKEGMVVLVNEELQEGLPSIEGIEMKDVKLYEKIKSSDDRIFEEILETSQEVRKYNLSMDRMVCKDDVIFLYIGTIRVNLGSKVSSEQIAQIAPIIAKLEGQEGTLHLENYSDESATITFAKESINE